MNYHTKNGRKLFEKTEPFWIIFLVEKTSRQKLYPMFTLHEQLRNR